MPPSTTILPTLRKRDAAYDNLKYWIIVKGCSTQPGATHYLGPGGWAVSLFSFPCLEAGSVTAIAIATSHAVHWPKKIKFWKF